VIWKEWAMAIEYTNRKRKKYYLHQGVTKTGNPKYFFSLQPDGDLVDEIPVGYEIYENPNAQVFLRKTPPQVITLAEIETVKKGINQYARVNNPIVDVKKNAIIIYLCDQDAEFIEQSAVTVSGRTPDKIRSIVEQSLSYSPVMQFVLEDLEKREFVVQRWCFLGSVDDWISLDESSDLAALVQQYSPHLGQDSFFDLMPKYS
jgi:hypothetical protein